MPFELNHRFVGLYRMLAEPGERGKEKWGVLMLPRNP
jgi:hypothetical protein